MTMLDRMRRHKSWLKWSLALVVLAFVVFYIPDFLQRPATGAAPSEVARRRRGPRTSPSASSAGATARSCRPTAAPTAAA